MFDQTSILKPNATQHDRAVEQSIRKAKPDLTSVATLMNPDTCPAHLLGWLAWAFSVDVWEDRWTEAQKRRVLKVSLETHRKKGTPKSIRQLLTATGYDIELEEWFEYGGAPHTFRVTAFGGDVIGPEFVIDPNVLAVVKSQIEAVKPVRSHMELRIAENFGSDFAVACGLHEALSDNENHDIRVRTQTIAQPVSLRTGIQETTSSSSTLEVLPRQETIEVTAPLHVGVSEETRSAEFHDIKRKRLN